MPGSQHVPIVGLVLEANPDMELEKMISRLYIILEINDIKKPFIFDVTDNQELRNIVCKNLPEEEA